MSAALRVEALVSGRLAASSRFRVLQYVEELRRLGVDVHARPPRISKYASLPPWARRRGALAGPAETALRAAKLAVRLPSVARSWAADVTWLERELLPGHRTLERALGRPLLFDVDDAIWLLPGHERPVRDVARRATCVLAGNDFLAGWFADAGAEVERVWTAVDTGRFRPRPSPPADGPFVVGWTGSASTMRYLEVAAPGLARFLAAAPDARLLVMADAPPDSLAVPPERVEFVRWSPDVEAEVLRRMDVGIMPLPDTDWGRGKCAFKMLQYLASGIPAVVSPVGMAAEVLAMDDVGLAAGDGAAWADALLSLHRDRDAAARLGTAGRRLVEERFSVPVVAAQLAGRMRRHG